MVKGGGFGNRVFGRKWVRGRGACGGGRVDGKEGFGVGSARSGVGEGDGRMGLVSHWYDGCCGSWTNGRSYRCFVRGPWSCFVLIPVSPLVARDTACRW